MDHPTVEPDDVSIDTKRQRLKRDLESLEVVKSVRDDVSCRNGVVFEVNWRNVPFNGDLPNSVLAVLADRNCFIPEQQPDRNDTWNALIHTDR